MKQPVEKLYVEHTVFLENPLSFLNMCIFTLYLKVIATCTSPPTVENPYRGPSCKTPPGIMLPISLVAIFLSALFYYDSTNRVTVRYSITFIECDSGTQCRHYSYSEYQFLNRNDVRLSVQSTPCAYYLENFLLPYPSREMIDLVLHCLFQKRELHTERGLNKNDGLAWCYF